MFTIMAIKVGVRSSKAPIVQEILTEYGDIINTRLGLHNNDKENQKGLILLNLENKSTLEIGELRTKLEEIEDIKVEVINI